MGFNTSRMTESQTLKWLGDKWNEPIEWSPATFREGKTRWWKPLDKSKAFLVRGNIFRIAR